MDMNWGISILYKMLSMGIGFATLYLGYQLFKKGVYGDTGDISILWQDNKLLLKRAAPGTLFTIFGAIIIVVAIAKDASYKNPRTSPLLFSSFTTEKIMLQKLLEDDQLGEKQKELLKQIMDRLDEGPDIIVENPNLHEIRQREEEGLYTG